MKKLLLTLFSAALFSFAGYTSALYSQNTNTAPKPETKESPKPSPTAAATAPPLPDFMQRPDYKAYTAGMAEKDAAKKVVLLEKYMTDFPDSAFISLANETLLEAIVKAYPNDKERIRAQAQKTIDGVREDFILFSGISQVSRTYNTVISSLYKAGLEAEAAAAAQKAFKLFDEANAKILFTAKFPIWISLGQDSLKKGDLKKAESYFKQSLSGEYEGNAALIGLAEVAEKRKKRQQQLEYLIQADAHGTLKKDQRNTLEEIYLKEKGSPNGLREMLDANYKKANPLPLKVVKYSPDEKRTKRTVLAELFTGSACKPCVTIDLAFDGLLERYNPAEIAVLVYHLHVPGPDPMTNPAAIARSKYYKAASTPTYFINGTDRNSGGGINRKQTQNFYDKIISKVDTELHKNNEADLNLSALMENETVKANVKYDGIKGDSNDLKLNIALVEHELSYMGENGIRFHQMVVRELGGDKREGFSLKNANGNLEWQFDLKKISDELKIYLDKYETDEQKEGNSFAFSEKKYQLDFKNLAIVAFIQDDKSKNILQSVFFDLAVKK